MTTIPISKAQADLSGLVDRCRTNGESFTITKGVKAKPVAVLRPVGGPETNEEINETARAASGQHGARAVADSRAPKDLSAGSKSNGKRRRPAKV